MQVSSDMRAVLAALTFALGAIAACGETRRPIGDECLRDEDCLSGVCSARSCVSAPPLRVGTNGPTPDEQPDIEDGGAANPPADAAPDNG